MKALILAAGKGRRLRPLTHTTPKQLLPLANRPVILYALEQLKRSGIRDIGIVVSPRDVTTIEEALGDGARFGVRITYIVQFKPLGTAHAVQTAGDFLGDSPFVLLLGDIIIDDDIREFVREFRTLKADAYLLLKEVPDPRPFGTVELDSSGKVVRLTEKPKKPRSNLILAGIYFFRPEIHKAIAQIKPSARHELEITDAIHRLLEMGREVRSHTLHGWWTDAGSKEQLLEANCRLLKKLARRKINGEVDEQSRITGKVEIGTGTKVENSVIRGPVAIAENCRIKNSTIQPCTSVGAETVVEDSLLEHSIILEDCQISSINLSQSIIGKGSGLTAPRGIARAVRLFTGDDTRMEL